MALKILDSSGLKYLLSKIKNLLSGKADKSTTLSGYGITNAYTKTETDTAINNVKYTLPNATSSVLGGVKVGTNISVSSGTISVANGSTSAKGVVKLTNSTSSTSTTTAATPNSVKSAYDLANSKQSPATTLAGYGITDAYTKTDIDNAINDVKYTLPTASTTLGGVKTTSTVNNTSGLTACPIISGVVYYKDTDTTYTLSSFGITATATELNKLDGVTATATEINYVDGVTSNIQTQLNALAKRIADLEAIIPSEFATVAKTGSYKDLVDLPTKIKDIKDY